MQSRQTACATRAQQSTTQEEESAVQRNPPKHYAKWNVLDWKRNQSIDQVSHCIISYWMRWCEPIILTLGTLKQKVWGWPEKFYRTLTQNKSPKGWKDGSALRNNALKQTNNQTKTTKNAENELQRTGVQFPASTAGISCNSSSKGSGLLPRVSLDTRGVHSHT